ncbi:hypothetical protein Pyn_13564 [Prunus yedoensis var. nudiflora]|uniref:Uncharacterized protein n=1 Tax=Prunus yedoensis var. nudiflora TaxID=2094558 RepID=A0A314YG44_PRUYE|nr:hypothetical protein Pyn_13564 [Prunus yedoensis var. nudiflora]
MVMVPEEATDIVLVANMVLVPLEAANKVVVPEEVMLLEEQVVEELEVKLVVAMQVV